MKMLFVLMVLTGCGSESHAQICTFEQNSWVSKHYRLVQADDGIYKPMSIKKCKHEYL